MPVDPVSEQHTKAIWDAFGRALKTEPREDRTIRGASGIDWAVEAISVDDKNSRVIVIAAESTPQNAALMRVDIQATIPDAHVVVARPIVFDIASFARQLVQHIGHSDLDITGMAEKFNELKAAKGAEPLTPDDYASLIAPFLPTLRALQNVKLPGWKQVLAFFQQAALIDWGSVTTGPDHKRLVIPLANVLTVDSMALDLRFGVCPIPLYEFMPEDWEKLLSGTAIGDIEERLKVLGIYQYFFPPPDQIALGVADRSRATIKTISSSIQLAPELGHPLGIPELVQCGSITEIVNQLQERGLLVEGELGMEVTPAGTNARASVKFRPREGLVSKLIQRFTVNLSTIISPKDFG